MNKLWLAAAAACASAAWAAPQTVYFNQNGQPAAGAADAAYLREYTRQGRMARIQDFYHPSHKKYSDPYQAPAAQIKNFTPVLDNGTLVLWHFNGRKKMTAPYQNGKPHGLWTNWYDNGNKSAQMPYKNGQTEGTGARFYRNGQKESEIEFRNNRANGYWRQWYADGSMKSEVVMKNDQPVKMLNWDEEGRPTAELTFSNLKRSGIMLEWFPDGNKRSESVYQDDRLISRTVWDEDGAVVESY
ncbi:MAG: toxin-antitoxin system YwqK family antitoxin [Neisseria sp.]|nr:toxin-antitoxin system YwqK family antitoxin [Neisseria sp.]